MAGMDHIFADITFLGREKVCPTFVLLFDENSLQLILSCNNAMGQDILLSLQPLMFIKSSMTETGHKALFTFAGCVTILNVCFNYMISSPRSSLNTVA